MKKYLLLALALLTLCMVGCHPNEEDIPSGEGFVLKAVVKANNSSDRIEAEVIESDYAYGIYWVLISDATEIKDASGNKISKNDIKVGDILEAYIMEEIER